MVLERFAKGGARVAGTGAGSFLGGFFNNPGVVVIAGVAIALFLFRDRISSAFGSLGESLGGIGNIEFPDITLPTINFPAINFPTFEFPDFNIDFGDPLGGIQQGFDDFFTSATEFFSPKVTEERQDVPFADPEREAAGLPPIDIVPDTTGGTADRFRGLTDAEIFGITERGLPNPNLALEPSDAELFARDFPEPFVAIEPERDPSVTIAPSLLDQIIAPFTGAGVSFEGGTIRPLDPTLSSLTEEFGITASQAADLLARINDDFGDFDFGTNTGSGIGSITEADPSISAIIPSPNVSDPAFEGLSAEEIALRLTGGNISNF